MTSITSWFFGPVSEAVLDRNSNLVKWLGPVIAVDMALGKHLAMEGKDAHSHPILQRTELLSIASMVGTFLGLP